MQADGSGDGAVDTGAERAAPQWGPRGVQVGGRSGAGRGGWLQRVVAQDWRAQAVTVHTPALRCRLSAAARKKIGTIGVQVDKLLRWLDSPEAESL